MGVVYVSYVSYFVDGVVSVPLSVVCDVDFCLSVFLFVIFLVSWCGISCLSDGVSSVFFVGSVSRCIATPLAKATQDNTSFDDLSGREESAREAVRDFLLHPC